MIEHTVKGIVSTLYENFDKKHIKGNELKNSMNALCECVSNKEDIKTIVKDKLEVVAETYNHFGGKVCPENYCEMMNVVCEGFNDTLADFAHRVKGKLVGTPEEAAQTVDYITNAIVNKLHQVYATKEQYVGKNIKGFGGTLVKLCLMVGNDESLIDSVLRNVIQQEVEVALESNPTINYRNRKRCVEFVKDCFGHAGGLMYITSDLLDAAKQALGVNESKRNTTTLNESELNKMLVEAVAKNIKKLTEGRNDEPSNTHYAVHKPTNTIVFSWDYSGHDSDELRQFKKDYFIYDLIDMGMDPKEVTILTRKACERKGIDPTDDSCWSNYPMTEEKSYGTMQEAMDDYDNISGEFSPNQIKNMTDIEDDDELNAAADAENGENMMGEIFQCLSRLGNGENPYKCTYSFNEIKDLFADFGFDYQGPDEEEESHVFSDGNRELLLTPTMFYEKQNMLRIQNLNLF